MSPEFTLYAQLLVVLIADFLLGDPRRLPHPVRFIGRLCDTYEKMARAQLSWLPLKISGMLAFVLVLMTTVALLGAVLLILSWFGTVVALIGALISCYFCFAAGDLVRHSNRVYGHLVDGDLIEARRAVGLMVGRDTASLNGTEVARACIESVSENMVDGVTAPLFWGLITALMSLWIPVDPLICAAVGCMAYKAVNTMDSMYGYRNEQYHDFGSFAARTDDLANFIPARLSGICVVGAAYVLGLHGRNSARVFYQDRLNSSSPNSGHTEAATAGALAIELGGVSSYFGKQSSKPLIGKGSGQPRPDHIKKANQLMLSGSILFLVTMCLLHFLVSTAVR